MNLLNLIAIGFLICVAPHFEKFSISGQEFAQEALSAWSENVTDEIALSANETSEGPYEKLF